MVHWIERGLDGLADHYTAACIFLAQLILTMVGVGNLRTVSILGLILCVIGLVKRSARIDPWIFAPLILYNLAAMASTYRIYGTITEGYGAFQSVFPVLYLLMMCLEDSEQLLVKRMSVLWGGAVAVAGLLQFTFLAAFQDRAGRLGGLLGNPNAMGIFLVISWFALMACLAPEQGRPASVLAYLEPVILMALALTLSMGSFVAMAAGVLVLLVEKKRNHTWGEALPAICRILAKASLGVGTGVLLYLAGTRTDVPWSCLPLLLYGAAMTALWQKLDRFLTARPRMAVLISAFGAVVALAAVLVRPSSIATFTERLEMMASALRYLTVNPLLGVGPFQWRLLDLNDGGKYFNTWHIHNTLLHVGVEMGWIAMAALAVAVVRVYRKKPPAVGKAGFTAFCLHNMIDTSFFYLGVTAQMLVAAGRPGEKRLSGGWLKAAFGLFGVLFAVNLCRSFGAA